MVVREEARVLDPLTEDEVLRSYLHYIDFIPGSGL